MAAQAAGLDLKPSSTRRLMLAAPRPRDAPNLNLIARSGHDTAVRMNSSVCIVRNSTMTRFGRAVEDVVR